MEQARRFLPSEEVEVVIHHSPCDDGHAAAALFYYNCAKPVVLHGLHPKDELLTPETRALIQGKNVVFVDIAFAPEVMLQVAELAKKVVVLDHHVTNQTSLTDVTHPNLRLVIEMDNPGVSLAWTFLKGQGEAMPKSLYYIGLKDVWKHETIEKAVWFTTAFERPSFWNGWIPYIRDDITNSVIEKGRVIYDYQRSVLKTMMEKVQYTTWRGYRLAIVNVPFPWISDIGAMMCESEPERTIAVIWNKQVTGPYSVSLRTHNPLGPNVEKIALEFGGGGHVHGAGLRMIQPPYEVFNEK